MVIGRKYCTYDILEVAKDNENLVYEGTVCDGICDNHREMIFISRDLPRNVKEKVLKHELSHMYLRMSELGDGEVYTCEELCEFVSKFSSEIEEVCRVYFREMDERRSEKSDKSE